MYAKCKPIAKVSNSKFIEMSMTENSVDQTLIQKEILINGAVVAEFKAPNKFKYYDKGILMDE